MHCTELDGTQAATFTQLHAGCICATLTTSQTCNHPDKVHKLSGSSGDVELASALAFAMDEFLSSESSVEVVLSEEVVLSDLEVDAVALAAAC